MLVIVYVTNTKALIVHNAGLEPMVNALHSRINDFYIFAGIVITLLLAINLGVFVRADEEVDRQIKQSFGRQQERITRLLNKCETLHKRLRNGPKSKTIERLPYELNDQDFDSQL